MSINKKTFRSGPYQDLIAQAVQVGDVIYLSGQVGHDESGQPAEGLVAQTAATYEHIKSVLAEFGASMENIVDETVFVTDVSDYMANVAEIYALREEAYGEKPNVSQTVVQVVALVEPALSIGIRCVAHL